MLLDFCVVLFKEFQHVNYLEAVKFAKLINQVKVAVAINIPWTGTFNE